MKREVKTFLAGAALSALVLTSVPTMAERVSKTTELFYNDIKVVINGNRADLKDAAGNTVDPFVIDGTTYLPVRAVANALDQAVSWDAKTQTVYIGKNDEISQPSVWVKDLESFTGRPVGMSADALEFGGYDYNNYLTSNSGKVFQNYWNPYGDNTSFLVNGKYKSFRGTLYLTKQYKDTVHAYRMLVYGDDEVIYTSETVKSGALPVDFDVDIAGYSVVKTVIQYKYGNREDKDWKYEPTYSNNEVRIGNAGFYE